MRNIILLLIFGLFIFSSCGDGKKDTAAEGVDQSKPEAVLQAVFDAAKTQNFDMLKGLCDPKGESDGDTKRICELSDKDKEQFVQFFATGKIVGEATIEGDNAEVKFTFGPEGQTKDETMKMIKRDGKWYLKSF